MSTIMSTDGLISVKERDYLEQDAEIRHQKYACISFLSPEEAIANKDVYVIHKFLNNLSNDTNELFKNLSEKFSETTEVVDMIKNLRDRYDYLFSHDSLQQEYQLFRDLNEGSIDKEYSEKNDFKTCVRGIKIRGTYENLLDAQNRAKQIRGFDDKFDIYICEVGCWCPWSPVSKDIENQEYAESHLNTLMKKYKDNMDKRDLFYQERFTDMYSRATKDGKDGKDGATDKEETTETEKSGEISVENVVDIVQQIEDKDPWIERIEQIEKIE